MAFFIKYCSSLQHLWGLYIYNLYHKMERKLQRLGGILSKYSWVPVLLSILLIYTLILRRFGLEIQNDSTAYIRGAINIKEGLGFTSGGHYISHFPAGISIIYAAISNLMNISVFKTALWFHLVALFGMGVLFKQMMRQLQLAEPIQTLGLILFLFSTPIWSISLKFLTELPVTFILTIGSYGLFQYLNQNKKSTILIGIGILLGIGILIRFAMIGFLGGFLLVLLWHHRTNWKKGISHALLMGTPALILLLSYSAYVHFRFEQESVDRVLLWHPITLKKMFFFIRTPFLWLYDIDYTAPRALIWLFGTTLAILAGLFWLKKNNTLPKNNETPFRRHQVLFGAMAIITLAYCTFLIFSISLFDGATPVDTRILSPLSIYVYLGILTLFNVLYEQSRNRRVSAIGLLGLCIIFNWTASYALPNRYKKAKGYNRNYWQIEAKAIVCDSQEVWIRKNRKIYTNGLPYWRLMDNREVFKLPELKNAVQQLTNKHVTEDMLKIHSEIEQDQAQLVYFFSLPNPPNKIPRDQFFSYFSDSSQFVFIPFKKGLIIQGKRSNSN